MNTRVTLNNSHPHPAKYYPVFAVDQSKLVIGEVYVYIVGSERQGRSYAYIDDLKVSENARGMGVARMLMERAHEIAIRESCYKVVANSHQKRVAARALYASLGYCAHGTEFRLDLGSKVKSVK